MNEKEDNMPDAYADVRALPLLDVLLALGWDAQAFKVRKQGQEFYGKCPIHGGKKNNTAFSFHVDGRWNCFSCGKKGRGAIDLCMAVKNVGFQEAVGVLRELNPRLVITPNRPVPSEPQKTASESPLVSENPPKKFTYEKYYQPSEWLQKRGFEPRTLERFGVGLYNNPARKSAYSGKIMIRIQRWLDDATVGYLVRDPRPEAERGDSPKYLMPAGLQKSLEVFGATQLRNDPDTVTRVRSLTAPNVKPPLRYLYLVESPFCVMKFWQLGIPAVSCFGWTVSPEQVAIIGELAKGVVFLPDANKRKEAAQYAGLMAERVWVKMPEFGIEDPEVLSAEQIRSLA